MKKLTNKQFESLSLKDRCNLNFENDTETSKRVYDKLVDLSKRNKVDVMFKQNRLKDNYKLVVRIPKDMILTEYLSKYILHKYLLDKGIISKTSFRFFIDTYGNLCFYDNEMYKLIEVLDVKKVVTKKCEIETELEV